MILLSQVYFECPSIEFSAGANVEFTYKNKLSVSLTLSILRRYATTASNLDVAEMVLLSRRAGRGSADPTGLNRTMTFSCANVVPTSASAAVASLGRFVSTREAVIVRGRSGDSLRSGMSGLAAAPVPAPVLVLVPMPMPAGAGEDAGGCGGEDMVAIRVPWCFEDRSWVGC
ncbi:hypothetical protein VP1G_10535 [Cytospora mali]|uniref:Uncharacterized protein n=1 Tax=Cytospora mali TaxID=578113 RepID=A0A194UN13_CYTMA|nr:hypothetical protein VP1G_10535 [Valsa mali var. pyri (nom. inval.)]